MEPTQSGVTPWGETVQKALNKRLDSLTSGRYRESNERILTQFATWMAEERGRTQLEEITTTDCRRYSQHLRSRLRDDDDEMNSGQSAQKYFHVVRAWLDWCVDDERLPSNPAKPNRASDPLPDDTPSDDQQFWSARDREAICATADRRVDESFDDDGIDTAKAYRDRALVYTIAYSGCRVAELCRESRDDRREGLRWRDVDLDGGIITVLGKREPDERAPLLEPAWSPLNKWRDQQEGDDDDVVFPRLDPAAPDDAPAMSTQSARDLLKELCEWSQYEFNEPLRPHGARRGLGSELYDESAELAQQMLRHQSVETTHKAYHEKNQVSVREQAEDVLLNRD